MTKEEKRAHPRIEFATEIRVAAESAIELTTSNISMGGVFVSGEPEQHPQLTVGAHVQLRLYVADIVGKDLTCKAQVTRVDAGASERRGFALRFFNLNMSNTIRLAKLIEYKRSK